MDASLYSPLDLAYLGDAVYELYIRSTLVRAGNIPVGKLSKMGANLAMAKTQAAMVDALEDYLSEDEKKMIQRGKNAKVGAIPSSCTAREYHKATGLECLIGYLHLCGNMERTMEIVSEGWKRCGYAQ